jgi:hypothetical protein
MVCSRVATQENYSAGLTENWQIDGNDIQIRWTHESHPMSFPSGIRLQLTDQVFRLNDSIPALLGQNGIDPNVDAFELVYQVNPDLLSLNEIATGTRLRLPLLELGRKGSRPVATLRVNEKLKGDAVAAIAKFNVLTRSVLGLQTDSGGISTVKPTLLEIASSLATFKRVILGRTEPIGRTYLGQIKGDAGLINEILQRLARPRQDLSDSDRQKIEFVRTDLQIKLSGLVEIRDPDKLPERISEAFVRVRTLKRIDGSEVPNLRVWFSPEALYDEADLHESFSRVSSPTEESLPEADYKFWATVGGEMTPVSEVLSKKVRKQPDGKPIDVDLEITQ